MKPATGSITSPAHRGASPEGGQVKRRLSKKTRAAVVILATEGVTQREAARRAGMNEKALCRALQQPHVAAALEAEKDRFIKAMSGTRAVLKARAIEVAAELMENAESEAIRARMVEFLAGERGPASQVNVQVNTGGSYEYVRRGQRVVTIEGSATDGASGVHDDE